MEKQYDLKGLFTVTILGQKTKVNKVMDSLSSHNIIIIVNSTQSTEFHSANKNLICMLHMWHSMLVCMSCHVEGCGQLEV